MTRVLIIDDEEDIRVVLKEIFVRAGFEVAVASDGNEGMNMIRENGADLVITDIIMPEKEGVELIMELRHDFPDVRIIAVSGGGQATASETCLRLAKGFGAVRTLAKPFSQKELVDTVQEVLDGK